MNADFLRAVVVMTAFKPHPMLNAQAALLAFALRGEDFTARQIPGEITNGNTHIAGAASGSLVAQGLITVVARVKSPDPRAKGRKLDVFRLATGKLGTAKAWFKANQFELPSELTTETQRSLSLV